MVDPVLIDTGMSVVAINWNHSGSVLAIAGTQTLPGAPESTKVESFVSLILCNC